MTGIMNSNGVALNRICIVPITCMRHVPLLPSFDCWFPPRYRLFYAVNGINGFVDVSQHIVVGIYIRVFLAHIPIETPYLSDGKRLDGIVILHLSLRILS